MDKRIRILGVAGSLRRKSYNRAALRAARKLSPEDAELEIFELDGIPVFSEDDERTPPAKVVELKKRIREADAVLFVTPEYNYSIPGGLKNAIDWASRPYGDNAWAGKPAAVMGASVGRLGTARAQYHLRQVFVFLNLLAVNQPEVMIGMRPSNSTRMAISLMKRRRNRSVNYSLISSTGRGNCRRLTRRRIQPGSRPKNTTPELGGWS